MTRPHGPCLACWQVMGHAMLFEAALPVDWVLQYDVPFTPDRFPLTPRVGADAG